MNKTFPKSRICVIDIFPAFEKGLKAASEFAATHNLSLHSTDGSRLLLGFCIKYIEMEFKETKSIYPKVMCISKKHISKKISNFIDNHFDKMMSKIPFPYCGKHDLHSPDLESAAENCLTKKKPQRKFNDFALRLKLKPNQPLV